MGAKIDQGKRLTDLDKLLLGKIALIIVAAEDACLV